MKKKDAKPPIKNRVENAIASLRADLERCKKSLRNSNLTEISREYYKRRREMLEAELAKHS